jgi:hypothetical protein
MEAKKSNEDLPQRHACCCEQYSQEYVSLMETLKEYKIIDYTPAFDESDDYESFFLDIKMFTKARIAFEKGIETAKYFDEVFMSNDHKGGITVTGNNYQIINTLDKASVTATQNNDPNMRSYRH